LKEAAAAKNQTVEEARNEMSGIFERLISKQHELEKGALRAED